VPIGPHITDFVSFPLKCVVDLVPASESAEAAATRAARRAFLEEREYKVVAMKTADVEADIAAELDKLAAAVG
jgi:tRNA/rRNA methyltransferase